MTHDAISRTVAALSALFVSIVLLSCLFVATPAGASPSPAPVPSSRLMDEGPVVVVGFSGVMWRDVTAEQTPNLHRFLDGASGANIVVRTVKETTCPNEGWLTLSSGQRAVDSAKDCRMLRAPVASGDDEYSIAHWELYKEVNRNSPFRARVGLLGSQLGDAPLAAIGPGAAVALADSEGVFSGAYEDVPPLPGSVEGMGTPGPDGGRSSAAQAYTHLGAGRDLVVVDLGSVRYPEDQLRRDLSDAGDSSSDSAWDKFFAAFRSPREAPAHIGPQLAALDARFGELLTAIEQTTPGAQILVISVGDAQNSASQLGFFAMDGSQDAPLATSDATRQWGLVQLTDVFPTVLGEVAPDSPALADAVGSPVQVRGTSASEDRAGELIRRLSDDQIRSGLVRPLVGPFHVGLFAVLTVVVVAGWRALRKAPGESPPRWLPALAAWSASLPVASLLVNLLPWWRAPMPALALFGAIAAIAGAIAWLALRAVPRASIGGPVAIISGVTALTLLLDVVLDSWFTGYSLQLASLLAMQPQVGGRFYGLGNTPFAIYLTGLLLCTAHVVELVGRTGRRWLRLVLIAVVAVVAVIVDGTAHLGADFGGPPAIVTGFLLLALLTGGARLSALRMAGVFVAALGTSVFFAVVDYMQSPQERSHLGGFIQTVVNGGGFDVITRKLSLALYGLPWWLVLIVFAGLFLLGSSVLGRHSAKPASPATTIWGAAWRDLPTLRHTVISVCVALFVGMVMNDSGFAIPVLGLAVAMPLWLIMVARHCARVSPGRR